MRHEEEQIKFTSKATVVGEPQESITTHSYWTDQLSRLRLMVRGPGCQAGIKSNGSKWVQLLSYYLKPVSGCSLNNFLISNIQFREVYKLTSIALKSPEYLPSLSLREGI